MMSSYDSDFSHVVFRYQEKRARMGTLVYYVCWIITGVEWINDDTHIFRGGERRSGVISGYRDGKGKEERVYLALAILTLAYLLD